MFMMQDEKIAHLSYPKKAKVNTEKILIYKKTEVTKRKET